MLARLDVLLRSLGDSTAEQTLYEFPLDEWYEIAGSRLRMTDFLRATVELADLCWRYRMFPGKARQRLLDDHDRSGGVIPMLSPHCRVIVDAAQPAMPSRRAA